jgi:cytochrome b
MANVVTSGDKVDVPVWDLPTRVFHWLLVAAVLVAWITGELPGPGFAIHKLAGYTIGGALIFRVIWGFIGSPHSRFADFIKPWSDIEAHARALLRMSPPRSVGHNPIGGWIICALMIVLATIVVSGLFSATRRLSGPFAESIPSGLAHLIADVHETAFNILLILVTIHVLGVIVDMALNRENLIGAMWWGRKSLGADAARFERPLAPLWWAVVAAVIGIIVMAWIAL